MIGFGLSLVREETLKYLGVTRAWRICILYGCFSKRKLHEKTRSGGRFHRKPRPPPVLCNATGHFCSANKILRVPLGEDDETQLRTFFNSLTQREKEELMLAWWDVLESKAIEEHRGWRSLDFHGEYGLQTEPQIEDLLQNFPPLTYANAGSAYELLADIFFS